MVVAVVMVVVVTVVVLHSILFVVASSVVLQVPSINLISMNFHDMFTSFRMTMEMFGLIFMVVWFLETTSVTTNVRCIIFRGMRLTYTCDHSATVICFILFSAAGSLLM